MGIGFHCCCGQTSTPPDCATLIRYEPSSKSVTWESSLTSPIIGSLAGAYGDWRIALAENEGSSEGESTSKIAVASRERRAVGVFDFSGNLEWEIGDDATLVLPSLFNLDSFHVDQSGVVFLLSDESAGFYSTSYIGGSGFVTVTGRLKKYDGGFVVWDKNLEELLCDASSGGGHPVDISSYFSACPLYGASEGGQYSGIIRGGNIHDVARDPVTEDLYISGNALVRIDQQIGGWDVDFETPYVARIDKNSGCVSWIRLTVNEVSEEDENLALCPSSLPSMGGNVCTIVARDSQVYSLNRPGGAFVQPIDSYIRLSHDSTGTRTSFAGPSEFAVCETGIYGGRTRVRHQGIFSYFYDYRLVVSSSDPMTCGSLPQHSLSEFDNEDSGITSVLPNATAYFDVDNSENYYRPPDPSFDYTAGQFFMNGRTINYYSSGGSLLDTHYISRACNIHDFALSFQGDLYLLAGT